MFQAHSCSNKLKQYLSILLHLKNNEPSEIQKIVELNWFFDELKEENMLTLITCVENEPNYRRCVLASEREEVSYY